MDAAALLEELERAERKRAPLEADGFRFTHLERVVWPDAGLTKGDLVRYYVRVASVMLRYLEGRPLMLRRFQGTIDDRPIVQQRARMPAPEGVTTEEVPVAEGEPTERYIGAWGTLLYAAQMNAVELHSWHSRIESPERPDWIILDLDPSTGTEFAQVVEVALGLRERLEDLGLSVLVKTSGSRGLHLHVPTGGDAEWEQAAALARGVAEALADDAPKLATVERSVDRRGRRIYIDHLQNARGKMAIAAYSPRARPGAPVAMPIAWSEVNDALSPRAFKIPGVPDRLEKEGDAWADAMRQEPGAIARALERLGEGRSG